MNQAPPAGAARASELSIMNQLSELEGRFAAREASIHAFIPEEGRFRRLRKEAGSLVSRFPEPAESLSLFGTFVGVKDIMRVDGFLTQAGSRLPAHELQGEEAESVTRVKNAGALILGKTVTTEFAYFSPGPTRNPRNPEHTPGGSSSGSAAAVGGGLCDLALGTQTIGSIIRPASFCGVVGFKPTYDRISRAGVIPLSPSLDHVGFFTSDVETAIRAAQILVTGWRPWAEDRSPVIGIPESPLLELVSKEGRLHFQEVCEVLGSHYPVRHVPVMSDFQQVQSRHDIILSAEAARVHAAWFEKYEHLYSQKFVELLRRGQSITGSQLQDALEAREGFRASLIQAMNAYGIDLWISPSTIGPAPKGLESTGDPVMNLPWTQAGLPAINLPSGKTENGLPLGLQVVGRWNMDEALLSWAGDIRKVIGPRWQ